MPRYDITEYQIGYAQCAHCHVTYSGAIGKRGIGIPVYAVNDEGCLGRRES